MLDLPTDSIAPKSWYVLAATSPFNVQSLTGVVANVDWNNGVFRSGATGGYLKKYQVSGSGYTEININTPSITAINDLLVDVSPAGASGHNYFTFLFKNGVIQNGFWGGGASGVLPSGITSMPNLILTQAGTGCSGTFTINFSTLGAVEFVNSAPGSDNGYARKSDGKCGSWVKTSAGVNHTPGATNGSASGLTGSLTTAQFISCGSTVGAKSYVQFDITAISGSVTEADDFPVEVQVYNDVNHNGTLDGLDTYIRSKFQATVAAAADTVQFFPQNLDLIIVYKTKRGCFDRVVPLVNSCASLPVNFKSFTAVRNRSNVTLTWVTASEVNNSGFEVQRQIGTGEWQTLTFVPSQPSGGLSNSDLTYNYNDVNNVKGVTNYRIRQIDIDGKSKYSVIRSVRGEGQAVKMLVYPNPSNDGRVKVVFEETNGTRDITLTDMNGRTVKQWNGVVTNNISIENLTQGVYTLRVIVKETGEQSVEKIVVYKR